MPQQSTWTPEDIQTLQTLWAKGWSAAQISRAMDGRHSRNGVVGKANRMGLAARDSSSNRGPSFRTGIPAPKPKPPVPELPSEAPAPIGPLNDHPETGCQYIHGDIRDQYQFCAQPQDAKSPYCAWHRQRASAGPSKPIFGASRAARVIR